MKKTKRKLSSDKLLSVAKLLKVIAHPVKLEILNVLEEQSPLDVTTISEQIRLTCEPSMMSQHLTKMKDNGVLASEKKGKQVFYSIVDDQILKIFDCMESCSLI